VIEAYLGTSAVMLEALNLEVSLRRHRAVKGIDLAVEEGEMVCLIGANGAGKTTTLKAWRACCRHRAKSTTAASASSAARRTN
jgi:ABC-type branched-subunit amino acid transport system ATPase component